MEEREIRNVECKKYIYVIIHLTSAFLQKKALAETREKDFLCVWRADEKRLRIFSGDLSEDLWVTSWKKGKKFTSL